MTLPVATEEVEQRNFVQWLDIMGYKYTAIPNSTFTRSWKQKLKNKEMGLRAGFPDMIVIANNKLICIELKRTVGGTVSELQQGWLEALTAAGVHAKVCKGAGEAIAYVKSIAPAEKLW